MNTLLRLGRGCSSDGPLSLKFGKSSNSLGQTIPFLVPIFFSRSTLAPQTSHHACGTSVYCLCFPHCLECPSLPSSPGSTYPSFRTRASVASSENIPDSTGD